MEQREINIQNYKYKYFMERTIRKSFVFRPFSCITHKMENMVQDGPVPFLFLLPLTRLGQPRWDRFVT